MRLELVHPTDPSDTTFVDWDEATGALAGPAAAFLERRCAAAAAVGHVTGPPHPTTYDIGREPLKSRRDLAVIIAMRWLVPDVLADSFPRFDDADDESDVQVTYTSG